MIEVLSTVPEVVPVVELELISKPSGEIELDWFVPFDELVKTLQEGGFPIKWRGERLYVTYGEDVDEIFWAEAKLACIECGAEKCCLEIEPYACIKRFMWK